MKLIKWGIFFIFAFTASFILLRTFSQDVFRETAPALVLGYTTPDLPLYLYIGGAFLAGLGLGLIAAIYNYISSTAALFAKSRRIKELEKEVDLLQKQKEELIAQSNTAAPEKKQTRYVPQSTAPRDPAPDAGSASANDDAGVNSFIG